MMETFTFCRLHECASLQGFADQLHTEDLASLGMLVLFCMAPQACGIFPKLLQ